MSARARFGLLQVCLAGVLWGTGGLVVQLVRERVPMHVVTISAWRMVLAAAVLVLAVLATRSAPALLRLLREHPRRTVVVGTATAAYQALYFASVTLVGVSGSLGVTLLKTFIDSLGPQWGQGLLADKVYAGFTASQTLHGGQESTLLALYNTIHHFGGIVVAPGYTDPTKFVDGNPYGASHVTGADNDAPLGDADNAALDHLATRVVTVAGKLAG